MKKLTLLLLLLISSSSHAWSVFGPKDYDECILENMKGVNTDVGARLVSESCSEKFKEKEVDSSQKNKWTPFNSGGDEATAYYNKSTITKHGKVVTVVMMVDYNKIQLSNNEKWYSVIMEYEFDCGNMTYRIFNTEATSGHMGEGITIPDTSSGKELKFSKADKRYKTFCME